MQIGNLIHAPCLRLFANITAVTNPVNRSISITLNNGFVKAQISNTESRSSSSSGNELLEIVSDNVKFTIEKVCQKCLYCNKLNALCYNNDRYDTNTNNANNDTSGGGNNATTNNANNDTSGGSSNTAMNNANNNTAGSNTNVNNKWHSALLEADIWELFRMDDKFQIFILLYHLKCNDLHECYGLNDLYAPSAVKTNAYYIIPESDRFNSLRHYVNKKRKEEKN
jgi:hypothetical protein